MQERTSAAVFAQGLYWEQTTKITVMGRTIESSSKGYLKPLMMKGIDVTEGNTLIVRADKEIIYIIDDKKKTYSELTSARLRSRWGRWMRSTNRC